MTPKPFTNNPAKKLNKMATAAKKINEAIQALEEAQGSAENWADWETIQSFKHQLEIFMSCDHGEAGFQPFLDQQEKKQRGTYAYNRKGQRISMVVPE